MKEHIKAHAYEVSKKERNLANNHHSFLIWITGLSGSGKSTIANYLERELHAKGIKTFVLDGDNIRGGININLTFSPEDRAENNRRIAEIAKLFVEAGIVVIGAFISPYKKDRETVKNIVEASNYFEVYVNTSLEVCEKRDVKGLYKKARAGEIKNMTGISAPYEAPQNPDVIINTETLPLEDSVKNILELIAPKLKLKYE